MPVVNISPPSTSTAPGNAVVNSNTALARLHRALIDSTHWIIPQRPRTYLVAVVGTAIFSAVLYALARRHHSRIAAAAAKCHGKRPEWVNEKGWPQRGEELREQWEEGRKQEEWERQMGLETQRQQEQEPQYHQQRRRWSDFTPSTSIPYPTRTPLPAPHVLAAMVPQPTIQLHQPHPYPQHQPQFSPPEHNQPPSAQYRHQLPPPQQGNAATLTKYWDENHEQVVGAIMLARGSGVRRHVRVFGT